MVACMAVLLAGYVILTWPKKVESEAPTVIVESAEKGDVEIYGEYNPYHKTSARLALYIQFFGIECRIFNFYLFPISSIRKQLDKLNRIFNKLQIHTK